MLIRENIGSSQLRLGELSDASMSQSEGERREKERLWGSIADWCSLRNVQQNCQEEQPQSYSRGSTCPPGVGLPHSVTSWVQSIGSTVVVYIQQQVSECIRGDPLSVALICRKSEAHLHRKHDGGAWWATVQAVTKSQTQLSDFTFAFKTVY